MEPDVERELVLLETDYAVAKRRVPQASHALALAYTAFVASMREEREALDKLNEFRREHKDD